MNITTNGKTGQTITERAELDRLPMGSVVVPLWIGDRTSAGLNACTKFFDDKGTPAGKWFRAIDDPTECVSGVYPLGARDYRDDIRLDVEYGPDTEPPVPLDRNGLGVLVVYDPRDQL